jgi:Lysine methyltransferase
LNRNIELNLGAFIKVITSLHVLTCVYGTVLGSCSLLLLLSRYTKYLCVALKQRRASASAAAASLDWADRATYQYPQRVEMMRTPTELADNVVDADCMTRAAAQVDGGGGIQMCSLAEEDRGRGGQGGEWDVVMGADVVWLEGLVPLLVGALDCLCGPHTLLLLAHQRRSDITDNLLFSSLSKFFDIEEVVS